MEFLEENRNFSGLKQKRKKRHINNEEKLSLDIIESNSISKKKNPQKYQE